MIAVIIDTNVLISGILRRLGPSAKIIKAWEDEKFCLITSEEIIAELISALNKPKLSKFIPEPDRKGIVKLIKRNAKICNPRREVQLCRDPKDNMILACAISSKVDAIVTGDKDIHVLSPVAGTIEVLSPSKFLLWLQRRF